jgi:hypothetical protein
VAAAYKKEWICEKTGQKAHFLRNGVADHQDYEAAKKGGDVDAALRVVRDTMDRLYLTRMKISLNSLEANGIQKPILVAPYKEGGNNMLARSAAVYLGRELGLDVDTNIVETGTVSRKTLSKLGRVFSPAQFEGKPEKGRTYIMVDDNMLSGSTFADLRTHLLKNGAGLAFSCALSTPDGKDSFLKPSENALSAVSSELSSSIKDWMKNVAGVGLESLTKFEIGVLEKPAGRRELRDYIHAPG